MPKTRRTKGRMGMRKSKQTSKFNKRNSKVYHNTRFSNKSMRRLANKEDKILKQKIDLHLKTHISKVPDDYKYKELMKRVYKTDNEVLKQRLVKQSDPKDFKNMGQQVNKLMGKPFDINTFFKLMLIFWVVQDKLVKHGLRPSKR